MRWQISILAPRAGRDLCGTGQSPPAQEISILAPRAGRDIIQQSKTLASEIFQSSRPVRGATPG